MQELDVGKNIYYNESGPSLDMGRLAKNLISKLWIMLLVGAIVFFIKSSPVILIFTA